jgi:hypothetical protein
MEQKNIKMSLETARRFWKDKMNEPLRAFLLENFTKEELEDLPPTITWENSFNGDGYLIGLNGNVEEKKSSIVFIYNRGIFKEEKQALSALAFAQLSHIVAKYNRSVMEASKGTSYSILTLNGELFVHDGLHGTRQLEFLSRDNANRSLINDRDLWAQYWML